MSNCKHLRKTNDYSFGEGYVQFCIECGTKFYWNNEPVTAVAEGKRCFTNDKGTLHAYANKLEWEPKEEQKGCCQCPEPKRDLSSAVVPFTCPCSCHNKEDTRACLGVFGCRCSKCSGYKSSAETHTVKNFGREESTYTGKTYSTQDRCTCANNVMYACAFCKKKYETERKEKHCFCGNISDPKYAHHPKECVFIGSYVKPDSPQEKAQSDYHSACTCSQPFGGVKPPCPIHDPQPMSVTTTSCFPKDYCTKSEIDELFKELKEANLKILENHHETHRGIESDEKEWRKALLDFISLPNFRWREGEHLTWKEMDQRFEALKSRFL